MGWLGVLRRHTMSLEIASFDRVHTSSYYASIVTTVYLKKTIHLTFDHKFGWGRLIYTNFSLTDSRENFIHRYRKDSPPHLKLKYVSRLPVKLAKITIAADFNGILHVRPQNSSCKDIRPPQ